MIHKRSHERGINHGSRHRVHVRNKVRFREAEGVLVIFAHVLFHPVVDTLEDKGPEANALTRIPVAMTVGRNVGAPDSVASRINIGGVEKYAMPVNPALVILFRGVPVDIEHVQQLRIGLFLLLAQALDKIFQPAVVMVRGLDIRSDGLSLGIVIVADVAPAPFIRHNRARELHIGIELFRRLRDRHIVLNHAFWSDRRIVRKFVGQVIVRATPDFHLVVHAPVLQAFHVVLEFVFPVGQNAYGRIRRPFFQIKRGIARLDQIPCVIHLAATRQVQVRGSVLPVFLLVIPVGKIMLRIARRIARQLEGVHRIHFRQVVEHLLRRNIPVVGIDVVVVVGVARDVLAPVMLGGVVPVIHAQVADTRLAVGLEIRALLF